MLPMLRRALFIVFLSATALCAADEPAIEVLGNLEMNLEKFIAAVRRGRERLQGRGGDDDLQP